MNPLHNQPFRDTLPADLLYDPRRDMWVRPLGGEQIEIGATAFGLFLAGEVIAFTPKPKGAEIELGRGLGTIETGKTVLAVHCPLSLRLDESNEAAEETPALLEREPYRSGWMIRGTPSNWESEKLQLVDAANYRAHCLSIEPEAEIECR